MGTRLATIAATKGLLSASFDFTYDKETGAFQTKTAFVNKDGKEVIIELSSELIFENVNKLIDGKLLNGLSKEDIPKSGALRSKTRSYVGR